MHSKPSTPITKQASCLDAFEADSLLPKQALEKILTALTPLTQTEIVPLRAALGRVLADDIKSKINVPSGRNAAMDGYAIQSQDLPKANHAILKLIGTSLAGKPFVGILGQGECVRIMTGAIMPIQADTVIMQEAVEALANNEVKIDNETAAGSNVRAAGEDIASGDLVLKQGIRLAPADLGLLASLGLNKILVYRKLRVAFFSTGDELRAAEDSDKLEDGMIYDSNRYTLYGMLSQLGVEINDLGIVKDDRDLLNSTFLKARDRYDVLISSGGVSVGEADYVKTTLARYGEINFWKIAMKPGRPLTFGKLGTTYFFGLPGNPVSVMVTFYQFVQPALKHLASETATMPLAFTVPCLSQLKKRPGRVEYQRGILAQDDTGRMVVRKTGAQGSGILRSMAAANCFIILPADNNGVAPNDLVTVQPFNGIV